MCICIVTIHALSCHGAAAGLLSSLSSGIVKFLVKFVVLHRRVAFAHPANCIRTYVRIIIHIVMHAIAGQRSYMELLRVCGEVEGGAC